MKYFTYQGNKGDCGFASLKMFLAKIHKNKDYLNLKKPLGKKSNYTIKELIEIAKDNGATLVAYQYERKFDIVGKDDSPFMAVMKSQNGGNHVVFINSFKDFRLEVFDPDIGIKEMEFEDFLKDWTGNTIEVVDIQKVKFSLPKVRITKNKLNILQNIISVLTVGVLVLAMFFIKEDTHFILPLCLLTCFSLFELSGKLCSIKQLQLFDNQYLSRLASLDEESFDEEYKNYNEFKKGYFSNSTKFGYSLFIACLIVVVLTLNSPYHAIPLLAFLIIVILDRFVLQKHNDKRKAGVEDMERDLFNEKDAKTKSLLLTQIHKGTYSYVFNISARKCVYNFVVILTCLAMMFLQKVISVNYVIFEYFIFTMYIENIDAALNYVNEKEKFNKLKAHFIDTFVY